MQKPDTNWSPLLLPEGPKRPYLVIVRTGGGSLHPTWAKDIAPEQRNWDLMLSHYDGNSEPNIMDADIAIRQGAFKFSAIHRLFQDIPFLSSYKAVCLCDDDILTSWSALNRLFDLFDAYNLDLAQPALTRDSYYSMDICLQQPECLLRFTNFVEVMVPVFSAKALAKCLPTFDGAVTGWGLDFVWPHLLGNPHHKIAVIDEIAVKHTRPVASGAIYAMAAPYGITPESECEANLKAHGLTRPALCEYGSVWARPAPSRLMEKERDDRLKRLIFASLSAPPAPWTSLPQGWQPQGSWSGGAAIAVQTPPLQASDWALHVAARLNLSPVSTDGCALIHLGLQRGAQRLSILLKKETEAAYRLAIVLYDASGQNTSLVTQAVSFGATVNFAIEIVPVIGWVRYWFDGRLVDEGLLQPFQWGTAEGILVGDKKLSGTIEALTIKPWATA